MERDHQKKMIPSKSGCVAPCRPFGIEKRKQKKAKKKVRLPFHCSVLKHGFVVPRKLDENVEGRSKEKVKKPDILKHQENKKVLEEGHRPFVSGAPAGSPPAKKGLFYDENKNGRLAEDDSNSSSSSSETVELPALVQSQTKIILKLQKEKDDIQKDNDRIRQEKDKLQIKINNLQKENGLLHQKDNEKRLELKRLQSKTTELRDQNEKYLQEENKIRIEVNNLQRENRTLQQKDNEQHQELMRMQRETKELKDQNDKSRMEMIKLQKENGMLRQKDNEQRQELTRLQRETKGLKDQNDKIQKEKDKLQKEKTTEHEELMRLQKEIKEFKEKAVRFDKPGPSRAITNIPGPAPRNLQQLHNKRPNNANNSAFTMFDKVFPHVYHHLEFRRVLKCRRVCMKWRNAVDSFLENHPSRRLFSKEVFQAQLKRGELASVDKDEKLLELERKFVFPDTESIQKFLTKIKSNSNPFIGRSVTFQLDENSKNAKPIQNDIWSKIHASKQFEFSCFRSKARMNLEFCKKMDEFTKVYWEWVSKLLTHFGNHIWHVRFAQYELGLSPVGLYKILQDCLPHLKNLKSLVVDGKIHHFVEHPPQMFLSNDSPETPDLHPDLEELSIYQKNELRAYLNDHPSLPELDQLESLEFLISDGAARCIQNAIITKCVKDKGQLLRFATSNFSVDSITKLPRDNLKEIAVTENRSKAYYHLEQRLRCEHPGTIKDLKQIKNAKLEKISLKDGHFNISSIVKILRDFPEVCCLDLEGSVQLIQDGSTVNQNKNVQSLRIKHEVDSPTYLDLAFLRYEWYWMNFYAALVSHFPKLRFLHIIEVWPFVWKPIKNGTTPFRTTREEKCTEVKRTFFWYPYKSLEIIKLEVMNRDGMKLEDESKTWSRSGNENIIDHSESE